MSNSKTILARYMPLVVALAILVGGLVSLTLAQNSFHVVLQKLHTPLQRPLYTLPKVLPPFRVRPGWVDSKLSADVVQVLGTHEYLLRKYWDSRLPRNAPGAIVSLNLNYYPTDFATPHVPNVCWIGIGLKRIHDSLIVIHNVPHANGTVSNMPMRFLSFAVPESGFSGLPLIINQTHGGRYINTAYTFQVDGRYVPDPQQVSELFWRRRSKYGYDAKIEIDVRGPCTRAVARRQIAAFLRAALPAIERRLPDWKKLNARPASAKAERRPAARSAITTAPAN